MTTDNPIKSWIEETRTLIATGKSQGEYTVAAVTSLRRLPRALDALSAMRELHRPVHQVFSWQAGHTTAHDPCETCHGKAGKSGDYEGGCWGNRDLVYTCAECRDDKGRDTDWPCPTAQAIEGAINDGRG